MKIQGCIIKSVSFCTNRALSENLRNRSGKSQSYCTQEKKTPGIFIHYSFMPWEWLPLEIVLASLFASIVDLMARKQFKQASCSDVIWRNAEGMAERGGRGFH